VNTGVTRGSLYNTAGVADCKSVEWPYDGMVDQGFYLHSNQLLKNNWIDIKNDRSSKGIST